ncbi:PTS lactose/cellobiose transporter subunit IIA [Allobaculum sp. JKK-2023]|uniref:PTS lactose/cellobiose transporter subunit IIA n=1 Tax=Allobaculum sp. JKK-2023 TaxID=3108943 RepID=UPI002B05835B|nr:PTS lactose/cellobiose transporter subunit IIA [Allobaculum sp. JKK-2023]
MTKDELDMVSFGIIADAGDGKSYAFDALNAARKGDFGGGEALLAKARTAIEKGRRAQTDLLFAEMNGEHHDVNVLLVHSQDHLMDAMQTMDLVTELVTQIKEQKKLEKRIEELERRVDK